MYPLKLVLSVHDAKAMYLRLLFVDESSESARPDRSAPRAAPLTRRRREASFATSPSCKPPTNCSWAIAATRRPHFTTSRGHLRVRKKLDGCEALSDSTIAIVISLIHQEQLRRQGSATKAHVDGLDKIVQMRGGLCKLEYNAPLVLKICK